jgi:hypothetical protein
MQTAQAQSGMNRDTAVSQQLLNMVNQNNPWGSVAYNQTGTTQYTDSSGKVVTLPSFSQTTTFSPEQQAIFDKSQAAQTNLAGIAQDQSARVADTLSDPFTFDNQAAADWAYDLGQSRIAPQQQQDMARLEAQLINRGLRPGSSGWNSELERIGRTQTDQNNQLALTGRSQAFSEALATRNQPINELTALLSGSQVSNPASMSSATPQTGVAGVDYSGLVRDNYQNKLAASQSAMGGLFGLAGSLGSAAIMSDMRVKQDISRVGTLDNGLPVYSYRYKWGGPIHIGLMAQDVEQVNPDAVVGGVGGYKAVDYGRAVQ